MRKDVSLIESIKHGYVNSTVDYNVLFCFPGDRGVNITH